MRLGKGEGGTRSERRRKEASQRAERERSEIVGETDEQGRARERCGVTCGRQRSPGKFPSRPRAGVGGSPGPSRPGAGPEAGRSLTVQRRRRQRSGRPRPSSCGAPPRTCPARPRSPAPGPEPPPVRGHVTRDLSGTRGAARHGVVGGWLSGSASASRPWGIRAASALPPGPD